METTNTLDLALACYPSNCSIARGLSKNQSTIPTSSLSDMEDTGTLFTKDQEDNFDLNEVDDQG